MARIVRTRCAVHGPLEAIDRFRALMFAPHPHVEGEYIFDIARIIPLPEALADWPGDAAHAIRAMEMALGQTPKDSYEATWFAWDVECHQLWLGVSDGTPAELAKSRLAKDQDLAESLRTIKDAFKATGYWCLELWYDDHWGTDRPVYDAWFKRETPFVFGMSTSSSFPLPAFEKIATLFPELSFDCACCDSGNSYAGEGWFNPPAGRKQFALCPPNDAIRKRVRG